MWGNLADAANSSGWGRNQNAQFILSKNWIANEGKSDFFPLAGGKWQFLYIIKLQRGLRTWKHGYILCRHCPVFRWSECFRQPRDCFTIIVNTLRKQDLVKQDDSMPHLEQQCVHFPSSGSSPYLCRENFFSDLVRATLHCESHLCIWPYEWQVVCSFLSSLFVGNNGDTGRLGVREKSHPIYLLMSKIRAKEMEGDVTCIDW